MTGILRVKDVYDRYKMHSLIVDENETLFQTVSKFAEQPELRSIFLVDNNRKLKGIVTRTDLLNLIKFKLKKGMKELPLRILIAERIKDVKINQVASTMSKNVYVTLDDPVEKALEFMINMDIVTIPVVDKNKNIIDDVTLSEILLKILL